MRSTQCEFLEQTFWQLKFMNDNVVHSYLVGVRCEQGYSTGLQGTGRANLHTLGPHCMKSHT